MSKRIFSLCVVFSFIIIATAPISASDTDSLYSALTEESTGASGSAGSTARRPAVGLRPDAIWVIEAEDILHLPTRGYTEVAGLQPGAMQLPGLTNTHDGPISIRASLPSEVVYLVDGISRRDPAAGYSVTFLNNNIIDEITLANNFPVQTGSFNAERTPAVYRFDVKLDKQVPIAGTNVDYYFWVLNVLNRENVIDVYAGSGEPDDTGWLETDEGQHFIQEYSEPDWTGLTGGQKYNLRQVDPYNYDTPRQIRFGARVSF